MRVCDGRLAVRTWLVQRQGRRGRLLAMPTRFAAHAVSPRRVNQFTPQAARLPSLRAQRATSVRPALSRLLVALWSACAAPARRLSADRAASARQVSHLASHARLLLCQAVPVCAAARIVCRYSRQRSGSPWGRFVQLPSMPEGRRLRAARHDSVDASCCVGLLASAAQRHCLPSLHQLQALRWGRQLKCVASHATLVARQSAELSCAFAFAACNGHRTGPLCALCEVQGANALLLHADAFM